MENGVIFSENINGVGVSAYETTYKKGKYEVMVTVLSGNYPAECMESGASKDLALHISRHCVILAKAKAYRTKADLSKLYDAVNLR